MTPPVFPPPPVEPPDTQPDDMPTEDFVAATLAWASYMRMTAHPFEPCRQCRACARCWHCGLLRAARVHQEGS